MDIKDLKAEVFDLIKDREVLQNKVAQINQIIQKKLKEINDLEKADVRTAKEKAEESKME